MLNKMEIIRHMKDEHQQLQGNIKLIGELLSERQAVMALQRAHADWIPGVGVLSEKRERLHDMLSLLEESLEHHYASEEKLLPPLLGELLMHALLLEHQEIKKEIGRTKLTVANLRLEGLSREELLAEESRIQEMIGSLSRQKTEHLVKEEAILGMVQEALEERAKQPPVEAHR